MKRWLLKKINPVEDFKALVIAGTHAEDHKILYCLMGIEDFDLLVLYLEISNVFISFLTKWHKKEVKSGLGCGF